MTGPGFQEPAADGDPAGGFAPRVWVSHGRALYAGPSLRLDPHRNAVTTAVVGLTADFELTREPGGTRSRRLALVPAGCRHHVVASGPMAFLYLDPFFDDAANAALGEPAAAGDSGVADRADRVRERLRQTPMVPPIDDVATLLGIARPPTAGRRLSKVVAAIAAAPDEFEHIEDAAALARLSVSRFQHVFRDELGLPFRRFRLWHRMLRVADLLQAGESLTTAALDAGFSSSSHLSSAFRDMFGLPPSALVAAGARFFVEQPAAEPA